jgi:uncharacterized membrane protein
MEGKRAAERLILFTDAVVAIAITLLILPLVEIVTADAAKHPPVPVATFLQDNVSQFFAFALSFVVIARVWIANHEIFANTIAATFGLIWLDVAWVFTVVIIPLPTEITAAYKASELTEVIYISTATVNALLLSAMSFYLYRHPELESKPTSRVQLWGVGSNTVAFLISLALLLIFPALGYYSLLVPALTVPLDRIVKPRILRREAQRASQHPAPQRRSSRRLSSKSGQ